MHYIHNLSANPASSSITTLKCPLVRVIWQIERNGILIDSNDPACNEVMKWGKNQALEAQAYEPNMPNLPPQATLQNILEKQVSSQKRNAFR